MIGSALVLALAVTAGVPAGEAAPALVLERGAVARHQMVAVGRDVWVDGDAFAGVTAIDGSAWIHGTIAGDVTVLGGDASLGPAAIVHGHVQVLGGHLTVAPGARIDGRSVAYPTFSKAWLTLLEGPSLGLPATSPVVLASKLGLLAAWLALTVVLFAAGGRALSTASDEVRFEPLISFATGLVATLSLLLTALLLSAALPSAISLPLVALVAVLAIFAKLWGTVAVFHALGRAILRRRRARRTAALTAAVVGLALAGMVKFVPYLGVTVWSAITLVGVGAALRSRFGQSERWVDAPGGWLARAL